MQVQHEHAASGNHALLASVNHGVPKIAATAHPGAFQGQGVVSTAHTVRTGNAHGGGHAHGGAPHAPPANYGHAAPRQEKENRHSP
jgi:hypothetical protein